MRTFYVYSFCSLISYYFLSSFKISSTAWSTAGSSAFLLVNIKNQDLTTKIVDMVPDLINRFTSKKADDPAVDEAVDDILNDDKK